MFKYKIAELANRPKGTIVKLSPIDVRVGTVIAYQRLLNAYLRELAAETRKSVLPAFEADKRFKRTRDSLIVDSESWFAALKSKEEEIRSSVVNQATNIFHLEAQKNTDQFMTNARKALGVDLTAVVHQEDLESILKDYADSNASLIKSLGEDAIKRVEQSVYAAKLNGMSSASLSKTFQDQFAMSQNRANLIASDQLNKLNSDFNRARQEQAGIEKYEWWTSKDERVRSRHRELQGKIYKLKEATGAEQGLPPGKPIRCRCLQVPIIEFGATAVEEVPEQPTSPEPDLEGPATRLATRPTAHPDFEDGREVLKVSGKAYMPDKSSNRDDNLIQVTIRTASLEENWSRNKTDYVGKDDKGIVSAGKGPDGEILRDKDGNPVKLSRKDWFKRWMQENPSVPIESPVISVDKTGLVDFTNGRHRASVLMHEEKVSNLVVTIHKDDLENAKEYLGAVHVKGKLKPRGVPSVKPVVTSPAPVPVPVPVSVPVPTVTRPKKTPASNTSKEKAWKDLNDKLDGIFKVNPVVEQKANVDLTKVRARRDQISRRYFDFNHGVLKSTTPQEIRDEYKTLNQIIRNPGSKPSPQVSPQVAKRIEKLKSDKERLLKRWRMPNGEINPRAIAAKSEYKNIESELHDLTKDLGKGAIPSGDKKAEFHKVLFEAAPTADKINYEIGVKSRYDEVEASPANNREVAAIEEGVEFFRNIIHKDHFEGQKIGFARIKDRRRPFFRNRENLVNYNYPSRNVSADTIIHELTHKIEYIDKVALRKSVQFLEKRQGAEKTRSINPNSAPGKEDGFDDEFVKKGGSVYTSRKYMFLNSVRATEVLTTGVERLYADPIGFRKQDPEHFEVTVKSLLKLW